MISLLKTFVVLSAFAYSQNLNFSELEVIGSIEGELDVSAISCISPENCLIASDETNLLQKVSIEEGEFVVDEEAISLGKFKKENDLEAMANDGKYFYAIGSHGVSRKKGKYQESRYKIFRILLDKQGELEELKVSSLESLLESSKLSEYLKEPLHENGVNIEGMAYQNGRLYFGFRSPVIEGAAQLLSVEASSIFEGKRKSVLEDHSIELGDDRGIRSMEFVDGDLYILSGESPVSKKLSARLDRVDLGKGKIIESTTIPYEDSKAEGFEFLEDNKVIYVYDSEADGLPTVQEL